MILITCMPKTRVLSIDSTDFLNSDSKSELFFKDREAGVINIGGTGCVELNSKKYTIMYKDALYVPKGTDKISFSSVDPANPAKFYIISTPAEEEYPSKFIKASEANHEHDGDSAHGTEVALNQYFHPKVVQTSHLIMGTTELLPGSFWNGTPSLGHINDKRVEIYLYFELPKSEHVYQMLGDKDSLKAASLNNEEAIYCPYWSIHSAVGTSRFSLVWAIDKGFGL